MAKSRMFLGLAFVIIFSHVHNSGFLLPGGFGKNIWVYGEQEEDRFETLCQPESTRSSIWAAPVAHVNSVDSLSSNDGRPCKFEGIVRSVSHRHGVDPDLIWAVMKAESNFNPHARSRSGARGLMQLMPGTARQHKVADIYDPAENINGGVRHLRLLLNRFRGDVRLAVAAYNAGARTVDRYKDIPPYAETRKYVRRVLAYYRLYSGRNDQSNGEVIG